MSDKNTVMVKEACGRSAFDFEVKIQVFQGQGVVLALWSKRQKMALLIRYFRTTFQTNFVSSLFFTERYQMFLYLDLTIISY